MEEKKTGVNGLILVSLVINFLVALSVLGRGAGEEFLMIFFLVMLAFWILSVVGTIMIAGGGRKKGAWLVIIGCAVYVPIGLIGVFGARKILDQLKREEAGL